MILVVLTCGMILVEYDLLFNVCHEPVGASHVFLSTNDIVISQGALGFFPPTSFGKGPTKRQPIGR